MGKAVANRIAIAPTMADGRKQITVSHTNVRHATPSIPTDIGNAETIPERTSIALTADAID
jgi:hypothetical protein